MKKLIAALSFISLSVCCWPQAGAVASRRYAEPTPLGLSFGSFQQVYPYNHSTGYNLVPKSQLATVAIDDNNFASTSDFTQSVSSGVQTFSVSGNQGTITGNGSASSIWYVDTKTSYSLGYPSLTTELTINQLGASVTTTSGNGIEFGLFKDLSNNLFASLSYNSASSATSLWAGVFINVAGTSTLLCQNSEVANLVQPTGFTAPAVPFTPVLTLVGNQVTLWIDTHIGGLQVVCSASTSSIYNFQTSGLTGWKTGFAIQVSASDSWIVSGLKTSVYGGTGIRDVANVHHQDGTPVFDGATAYYMGTVGGLQSNFSDGSNLIFSLNMTNGLFTPLGTLGTSRGGGIYNDQAYDMFYNKATDEEQMTSANWATSGGSGLTSNGASQSISADDWLSAGMHVSPATSPQSFPGAVATNSYDAHEDCVAWNYTANLCDGSNWILATSSYSNNPPSWPLVGSSSTPINSATWAQVFNDSASALGYEGSRIIRTATTTGGNGVTYTYCWAGGTPHTTRCYNSTGTFLGALNATPPANGFPAHPDLIAYGNSEYWVSFDGDTYNTGNGAASGNLVVATAQKYASSLPVAPEPDLAAPFDFYSSISPTITDTLSGATLCYTTDGSVPVADGNGHCRIGITYTGPPTLSATTTVRAVASKAGYQDSWMATAVYTSMPGPVRTLYSYYCPGSTCNNLSTNVYVQAGTVYLLFCGNGFSTANSFSYSTAPATTNSVTSGNALYAWANWGAAGVVTITCNEGNPSYNAFGILECPQCNGTVENIIAGSGTPSSFTNLSATNRNYTVVISTYGRCTGTFNTLTMVQIWSQNVGYPAAGVATPAYSGQNFSCQSGISTAAMAILDY